MKCQILFAGKNGKNIIKNKKKLINLSSAEFVYSALNVNCLPFYL